MHPTSLRRTPAVAALAAALLSAACQPASLSPSPSLAPSHDGSLAPSVSPAPSVNASVEPSASGVVTYTVVAGDTLFSIAQRWQTTVAQLQAWNVDRYPSLVSDPASLQVGWVLIVSGDSLATPLPTTPPTSQPPASVPPITGCRAGNRVPAGSPQTFTAIPGAGHAVALTLDMGGRLDPALEILDLLIEKGVCVTLFPTGAMADTAIGRQVMAVVRAHPELFELGNHTMHHCDLVRGGGGSPSAAPCAGVTPTAVFVRDELTDAAAILKDLSGQSPIPYWRPPYGSINQAVVDAAASVGYTKTFLWDIDTIDWKPISEGGPTAEQIAAKVITQAGDGSNVLMHLGGYETLDALRIMIPGLRERGFLLTSLSDLLN